MYIYIYIYSWQIKMLQWGQIKGDMIWYISYSIDKPQQCILSQVLTLWWMRFNNSFNPLRNIDPAQKLEHEARPYGCKLGQGRQLILSYSPNEYQSPLHFLRIRLIPQHEVAAGRYSGTGEIPMNNKPHGNPWEFRTIYPWGAESFWWKLVHTNTL